MLGSTSAQSKAVAPPARRDRAETSFGVKPYWRPRRVVARRRAVVMAEGETAASAAGRGQYEASGVVGGAECRRRWTRRRAAAKTGQQSGSPLRPRPMTSPRTPFFCVVNSSVTKVAPKREESDADARSSFVFPTDRAISQRRNGWASGEAPVYSPGRSKKKKAKMIMSAMACKATSVEAWAVAAMCWMIGSGRGLTRCGGGSCLWKAWSMRLRRWSTWPGLLRRGSGDPRQANVCPTLRSASSTVRERTGSLDGLQVPVRYRRARTCRTGTGSRTSARVGSTWRSAQNWTQVDQWVSLEVARLRWTPWATICCASTRSRRKLSAEGWSAAAKSVSEGSES